MVKNEAMASVFGNSATVDTDLINKVKERDTEYDKAKKKKSVTFNQQEVKAAAELDTNTTAISQKSVESSTKSDT